MQGKNPGANFFARLHPNGQGAVFTQGFKGLR
jgi:hypothetical protein